jgi:hypothetical protein
VAATTTSCETRARIHAGGLALAAALALGCSGSSQSSDGGSHPSCGGTIDFKGSTDDGPFTATSLNVDVSSDTSTCMRGLHFVISDSATGATFQFDLLSGGLPNGLTLPPGPGEVGVQYDGPLSMGLRRTHLTTPGRYNITASTPPPFATCEQSPDAAIDLHTGSFTMSLSLSENGFAVSGTLSTPYCSCSPCPNSN